MSMILSVVDILINIFLQYLLRYYCLTAKVYILNRTELQNRTVLVAHVNQPLPQKEV